MSLPAILGGSPVRTQPFPSRRTMGAEERAAVLEVMDSDVLSAFIGGAGPLFLGGPKIRAFEQAWAERYGFRHAVSVNSWTSGLVMAIGAVGIEPGDEVICSPYTMSASATCALFYGGIPVFADIDPDTCCLDPKSVATRITERTRAIVVVHLFGHPADMDALLALARPHDIRVIEDAAQAPGVYYRGRAVGTIGDIGGFSLNYHKHIHTGEGGMLVTNDDTLAWRARLIRNHGENAIEDPDGFEAVNSFGGNYRLTELQAAIGIEQLKRLDGYLNSRTALAAHLRRRLEGLPGLTPAAMPEPGSTHAYYSFPIHYNSARAGLSRAAFVRAVRAELPASQGVEGIPLFEGYVRPLYLSRLYQNHLGMGRHGFPFSWRSNVRYEYAPGLCPVAERLYERELLLTPLVREPLIECDLDALADACEKVLTHAAQIRDSDNTDQHAAVLTPLAAINDATQV